jgi:hypothetical protein
VKAVLRLVAAGHHDDRHQIGLPVQLEIFADVVAVDVRQHEVEKYQVGMI